MIWGIVGAADQLFIDVEVDACPAQVVGAHTEAALDRVVEAAITEVAVEAQGEAEAILAVATATAEGLRSVANAVINQGGSEAMQLRVAEQYIGEFGKLAKAGNTFVVPSNLADLTSMMALATDIAKRKTAE